MSLAMPTKPYRSRSRTLGWITLPVAFAFGISAPAIRASEPGPVAFLPLTAAAVPQEHETEAPAETPHGAEPEGSGWRDTIFQWINFLMVAAGIWYVSKKFVVPFLEQRARAIREDMERSAQTMEQAAQRLSAMEGKLLQLGEEIGALRSSALQEVAAERARIEELASTDAGKIVSAAEQEIAAATKAARQELKRYTAELAIGLAEKKLQESMSPQADQRIVHTFVRDLTDNTDQASPGNSPGGLAGRPGKAKGT